MGILVILSWAPYLLVRFSPGACAAIRDLMRMRDPWAYALLLAAIAAAFCACPTSADKGGGEPPTNPPPAGVSGVIRLYHRAPDGRLYPFDSFIMD
jgi:hypothetical protein